jgi:hypothetical protein
LQTPARGLGYFVVVFERAGQTATAFEPAIAAMLYTMVRLTLPFRFAHARPKRFGAVPYRRGDLEERIVAAVLQRLVGTKAAALKHERTEQERERTKERHRFLHAKSDSTRNTATVSGRPV